MDEMRKREMHKRLEAARARAARRAEVKRLATRRPMSRLWRENVVQSLRAKQAQTIESIRVSRVLRAT